MVYCLTTEKYELAEMDRKKTKVVRKGLSGPFIRYVSTRMPLVEPVKDPPVDILGDSHVS